MSRHTCSEHLTSSLWCVGTAVARRLLTRQDALALLEHQADLLSGTRASHDLLRRWQVLLAVRMALGRRHNLGLAEQTTTDAAASLSTQIDDTLDLGSILTGLMRFLGSSHEVSSKRPQLLIRDAADEWHGVRRRRLALLLEVLGRGRG